MEPTDDDEIDDTPPKTKSLGDQLADVELAAIVAGPDGAPIVPGHRAPLPPVDARTCVCLRGPCRHYWELRAEVEVENPDTFGPDGLVDETGTPLPVPQQITRTCTVHPGTETDLAEGAVVACNRWDPQLATDPDLKARLTRRETYYKINPTHRPEKPRHGTR